MQTLFACGFALFAAQAVADEASDWWVYVTNDHAHRIAPLLKQGANPNRATPDGQPTIMQAMRDKAWKVYDLVAADPRTDVNAANRQNETPLMFLAVLGETTRAKALIARGAQVNRLGWTPLHYAASKGKIDTVNLLLAQRAIVNAPAPDGTTPLMMGAYSRSKPVVDRLLAAGADPTTRNLQGLSAADWARSVKETRLAETLESASGVRDRERRGSADRPVPGENASNGGSRGGAAAGGGGVMFGGGGGSGGSSGSGAGGADPESRLAPTSGSRAGAQSAGGSGVGGNAGGAAPGAASGTTGSNGGANGSTSAGQSSGVGGVRGLGLGSQDDELPDSP
ncbi:ankyrin repeat domain-containing protein [Schauerella aestuarii]|uniref:ankyrin repeat domain-containing protein n=1 Tax=Schauerella aestuarii TaxID=2511204 RepID=UPI001F15C27F